jgi:hypothetical protein
MKTNEAIITYFGQRAKVKCDRKCGKAWGRNSRPKEQLSDNVDDVMWFSDRDLGIAPTDPRTYEGGVGKPLSPDEFPQKWCVRECERCVMSNPGEYNKPLELPDWKAPVFNMHYRKRAQ